MEMRHELSADREVRAVTETGQFPEVPETSDATGQPTSWRTSAGVLSALVLAFVMVTLVSL